MSGLFKSVGKFLFGSDPKVSTQKTPTMSPEQQEYLKQLTEMMTGQLGQGVDPYSGQMSPGASPLEQMLFGILGQRQGGISGLLDQTGQNLLDPGNAPQYNSQYQRPDLQAPTLDPYDPAAAKDYWQKSFVDPTRQSFYNEVLPGLDERYAGMGAMSGSGFNKAIADAAGRMETGLGAQLGNILFQDKSQHQQLQHAYDQLGLNYGQLGLGHDQLGLGHDQLGLGYEQLGLSRQGLGMSALERALGQLEPLFSAGATQRGIEGAQLGDEYQKWMMSQPWANPWMQYAGLPLGVSPYQVSHVAQEGSSGFLGGMAPGIGMGLGSALGGMFSDKNLKKDITYTGRMLLGKYPEAEFKWNQNLCPGFPKGKQVGVIAQDVQEINPKAVFVADNGWLAINLKEL